MLNTLFERLRTINTFWQKFECVIIAGTGPKSMSRHIYNNGIFETIYAPQAKRGKLGSERGLQSRKFGARASPK